MQILSEAEWSETLDIKRMNDGIVTYLTSRLRRLEARQGKKFKTEARLGP